MTQLSKEQALQALKHLETVFEQYTQTANWHLTGPVELARVCRDFIRYIHELVEDAGLRPGDIPSQLKLVLDMLSVSENFLDLSHVYVPFVQTKLIDRSELEKLWDGLENLEKTTLEKKQLHAEVEDRTHAKLEDDLDSLKVTLINLRQQGF